MSGLAAKWVVQRFEPTGLESYTAERHNLAEVGYPTICEDWREACEAVTLAIGPNCLQVGVPANDPLVFERDGVIVLVYMKLGFFQ